MGIFRRIFHWLLNRMKEGGKQDVSKTKSGSDQPLLQHISEQFKDCDDLERKYFPDLDVTVLYFGHTVDSKKLLGAVVEPLLQIQSHDLKRLFQSSLYVLTTDESREAGYRSRRYTKHC